MGKFTPTDEITSGGQGVVWRGVSDGGDSVAIKYMLLDPSGEVRAQHLKRFEHEVKCQLKLDHPGIMPILAADLTSTKPHFVMPLADGGSLRKRFPGKGEPLPRNEAIRIFSDVLQALSYAHREGVIHRDIKPENILFFSEKPVVSDFGLGRYLYTSQERITNKFDLLGTEGYSAPEQFVDASDADSRADVYSLGVLLAEMLSGTFRSGRNIQFDEIPALYRYMIMKSVDTEPGLRYPSAVEMASDFQRLQIGAAQTRTISDQVTLAQAALVAGQDSAVDELLRVFIDNEDDAQLYLKTLTLVPVAQLKLLSNERPKIFARIIGVLCGHATGRFTGSYVDHLAYFLRFSFSRIHDETVRLSILDCLIRLAIENDRDYPLRRFSEICVDHFGQPGFPERVTGILVTAPGAIPRIARFLREIPNLPSIVDLVLERRGY